MSKARSRRLTVAALALLGALLTSWTAAAAPVHHAASRPVVTLGSTDLGKILIDGRGQTLYMYTPDKKNTSTCYGTCAKFWPPLLTAKNVKARAAHGVKQSLLSTTRRTDGKLQVVYAGHPLYFFAEDAVPGDVFGQGFQNIWYALSVTGAKVSATAPPMTAQLSQSALGSILTDSRGITLYMFTPDTNGTSTCYGACATSWPPLILSGKLRPGPGLQSKLFGTTQRTDGTTQVTFNGHPLYFYAKDTKAGDTVGQGVGTRWWVLAGTGTPVGAP